MKQKSNVQNLSIYENRTSSYVFFTHLNIKITLKVNI